MKLPDNDNHETTVDSERFIVQKVLIKNVKN